MKNYLSKLVTVVMALSMILLTGCGSIYDFSEPELSKAIGLKEEDLSKASISFELKAIESNYGSVNNYYCTFDRPGGAERIDVSFNSKGELVSANIGTEGGNYVSRYCIYGVHLGDSKEMAEAELSTLYGKESTSAVDAKTFCTLTYKDNKLGFVNVLVEKNTNKVTSISLLKN